MARRPTLYAASLALVLTTAGCVLVADANPPRSLGAAGPTSPTDPTGTPVDGDGASPHVGLIDAPEPEARRQAATPETPVVWRDGEDPVVSMDHLVGSLHLPPGTRKVSLSLRNARLTGVPNGCVPAEEEIPGEQEIPGARLLDGSARLVCRPTEQALQEGRLTFRSVVVAEPGAVLGGQARLQGPDGGTYDLPERSVDPGGAATLSPRLRLVSSPDFLNADVADLRRGPTSWRGSGASNGINGHYRRALGAVLDDWASLDPAGVLVAGDLVNGRWGSDQQRTGIFGPVRTMPERRAAVRRAARTYYPQWRKRFTDRGLEVFTAPGDHEYGDNPWGPDNAGLLPTFQREYTRAMMLRPDGRHRFADRPPGPASGTAYAHRFGDASGDLVQLVSLDMFSPRPRGMELGVDPQQLRWLRGVLAKARADRVRWIVVQGHLPIVWPVPSIGSSELRYPGGTDSRLWRTLARYDVDLYLTGEVHRVSVREADGITQIAHGGMFQYAMTDYLLIDVYDDGIYLSLRDFPMVFRDRGRRLWETERAGMPRVLRVRGPARTVGTATLDDAGLTRRTGILGSRR